MKKVNPQNYLLYLINEIRDVPLLLKLSNDHWSDEVDKYKKSLNYEDDNHRYEGRRDLYHNLEMHFFQLQKKGLLVMLYSLFEDRLKQYCKTSAYTLHFDEINENNDLNKIKKYLSQDKELKLIFSQSAWQKIKKFYDVRNIVTHNAGYCDETKNRDNKIVKNISQFNGLEINEFSRVYLIIEDEFIIELVNIMRDFCNKIIDTNKFKTMY